VKTTVDFQSVLRSLRTIGFLLESDAKLPSVASLVSGEPIRGSWWSHPAAQVIFQINEQLEDHEDVLIAKLVSGKVTFVHRNIWSEVIAIGRAREPWQLKNLSTPVRKLLEQVEEAGSLTTTEVDWPSKSKMKLGDAVRELERRLLIVGTQYHSESGAHEKRLETWKHWIKQRKFRPTETSTESAKLLLESNLRRLNDEFGASATLPWQ
jgi:hypothetical protein